MWIQDNAKGNHLPTKFPILELIESCGIETHIPELRTTLGDCVLLGKTINPYWNGSTDVFREKEEVGIK